MTHPARTTLHPSAGSAIAAEPVVADGAVAPAVETLARFARLGAALLGRSVSVDPTAGIVGPQALPLVGPAGQDLGVLSVGEGRGAPAPGVLADLGGLAADLLQACRSIQRIDHVSLLPNRESFLEETGQASGDRTLFLVTLADARHFNEILRALGQGYADDFVRAGAERLRSVLGSGRPVWHVSVLSFCFLAADGPAADEALASAIARAFAAPLACRGLPVATRAGIGLVDWNSGSGGAPDMLRSALVAAQESRATPQGWARYCRKADEAHQRAFRLLTDLRSAVAQDDGLAFHFQPRVDMASGACHGAEALIRWTHPQLGPVSPGEFIPLAETTALIDDLTGWVVEHGVRQIARWREGGLRLRTSLNISPACLRDTRFVERLAATLSRHGVPAQDVELEFTETAFASSEASIARALADVAALGIDIAIDDFGTGYSNLSYLTRLPAQVIKIDQSFVRPLQDEERCRLLVRGITEMAHALGFRVVAEGIETQGAYDLLQGWHCDEGQGYFLSRPLAPAAFETWLSTWCARRHRSGA